MASFGGVAGAMRGVIDSEEFDLGSTASAGAASELMANAFTAPREGLLKMVRLSLVVGAGKNGRAKYDAALQKWVVAGLKAIDYVDDRSATCEFASAGSFKVQHDTGRNLFFVHVFPRAAPPAAEAACAAAEEIAPAETLSREQLLAASEVATFQKIASKRCASWSQKKRLLEEMRALQKRFEALEGKLVARESLSAREQALYELSSATDVEAKSTWLFDCAKKMVEAGELTSSEKVAALEQMSERLLALEAQPAGNKKAAQQRTALAQRRAQLEKAQPAPPRAVEHDAAIRALQAELAPLEALDAESRSGKLLTLELATKLGAKPELEQRISALEQACRGWHETDAELEQRLAPLRAHYKSLKAKAKLKAKAPPPSASSWGTVTGNAKGKRPSARSGAKPARSGGGFAVLGD